MREANWMNPEAGRKECVACRQSIHERAKICPQCKQPQIRALGLKVCIGLALLCTLVPGAAFGLKAYTALNRDEDVAVVNSQVVYAEFDEKRRPVVVGVVRNRTERPLRGVRIEVRLFNAGDELVGVCEPHVYRLRPRDEAVFEAQSYTLDNVEVARHEVRVVDARARLPWSD